MIRLTPPQRQTLLAWQQATNIRAGLARRARLVLLLADDHRHCRDGWHEPSPCLQMATAVCAGGAGGLHDKPRPGHRLRPLPPSLRDEPNNVDAG
jgi:hypothetical protein